MKSGSLSAYRAASDPENWHGGTPDDEVLCCRFSTTETRVAAKQHVCDCGLAIEKGEQYRRSFAVVDDDKIISKVGFHRHSWDCWELDEDAPF